MNIEEVADRFTLLSNDRSSRFEEMAGAVFEYQRATNPIYSRYCEQILPSSARPPNLSPEGVPYLPVAAFKHGAVATFDAAAAEAVFMSSATGSGARSRHFVKDRGVYERSVSSGFERVFGNAPWRIVAHLPEYAAESSLVYMLRHLIESHGAEYGGFTLKNAGTLDPGLADKTLEAAIDASARDGTRLMVFGAAFGLVDLVASRQFKLPEDAIVVETGGMKTHQREISRAILHQRLADGFAVPRRNVRSEYGMCELLSQCYTHGGETFSPPPWMRCFIVDPIDPTRQVPFGRSGMLAVLDLANLYSCSFVLTGDRAVQRSDGYEILGRMTDVELRGCNFLLENA